MQDCYFKLVKQKNDCMTKGVFFWLLENESKVTHNHANKMFLPLRISVTGEMHL